jgi:hypothetical protein
VYAFCRRHPSAVLLAAQLLAVLVYPFLDGPAGRAIFSAIGIALLGLVVVVARRSMFLHGTLLLLAVPATVLLVIQAITNDDALLPYSAGLEAVLYFYAAATLIRYMLLDHVITRDELYAIGATFTLVAWGFAYVFVVIQAVEPGSFTAAVESAGDRSWMELLFLSFTNLTSTGLSDVVPVKDFARAVVMIEQITGLAYVAMLVSRLVALTVLAGRISRD